MKRFVIGMAAIGVLVWGGTPSAHGQKATEMFIPIGQSPGLSGKITVIGTVETVDSRDQTVVVTGSAGSWEVKVTKNTRIWLDRSKLRLSNKYGTFADLKTGRLVEVKYEGTERKSKGPAEWIKVEVTTPTAKLEDTRQ